MSATMSKEQIKAWIARHTDKVEDWIPRIPIELATHVSCYDPETKERGDFVVWAKVTFCVRDPETRDIVFDAERDAGSFLTREEWFPFDVFAAHENEEVSWPTRTAEEQAEERERRGPHE